MYKKMLQAVIGKIYWSVLHKKYRADKYIFFPKEEAEYFKWGMRLLPQYIERHQLRKTVVVSAGNFIKNFETNQGKTGVTFKKITNAGMHCFMSYYALKDMSRQWVVVSTGQPYDTGAERLLGIKGVTYRDIVYYDIYKCG